MLDMRRRGRDRITVKDDNAPKLNRESLKTFRRMLPYVRPYVLWMVLAAVALLVTSGVSLLLPLFVRDLVDVVFMGEPSSLFGAGATADQRLNRIVMFMFAAFVVQAVFSFVNRYTIGRIGEAVVRDIRTDLFAHLQRLSLTWFADNRTGEIISRVTNDTATIQNALSGNLISLLRQIVLLLGAITFLFYLNWKLTLIIVVAIPLMSLTIVFLGRQIRQAAKDVQDKIAQSSNVVEETVSGIRVVKSFAREPYQVEQYNDSVQAIFTAAMRRVRIGATFGPLIGLIAFSCITAVFWYGSRQVIDGVQTSGSLVAYLIYTITVSTQVASLAGLIAQFQTAIGASERIFEMMDTRPDIIDSDDAVELPPVIGQVQFNTVDFQYDDRVEVLDGVGFTAEPGQIIAVVGPSGAGKSTLINLIPRFYDVTAGSILIDQVDLRDVTVASLRGQIGIVPQETMLFSDTVANNIRYGKLDATDDEIRTAAEAANAHTFITDDLPDQYETLVGERGVKLSGGQRQRIAIARAILKDPRILILDEATSSLDSESERLVQDALERLMHGRTSFVIAHRLSTVVNADHIVVLDHGRIVEQGTHATLLTNPDGLYTRLHAMQFAS